MYRQLNFLIILIITAFILTNTSCSSSKDMEDVTRVEMQQTPILEKALLWKISGNELTKPSYLYGTIHIINDEDYFLPEGTLSAMEMAENVIFEIDMNEMTDLTAQMGLLNELFMKDNLSLKDLLSEEDYTLVQNHFKEMGLPIFMLERMKPMFLSIFGSGDFDIGGLQNGKMKSYEMEFFDMAQRTNKPVSGLETMEFQMSMFDSIPYTDQAKMLVETIKSSDAGSDQFKAMTDVYKSQDINAMVTMISDDESGMGDFDELLVDMRNKNWIPIMEEKMKAGPVFFAVGAGHLAGKNGVIPLLMRAGYTLMPIKTASQVN